MTDSVDAPMTMFVKTKAKGKGYEANSANSLKAKKCEKVDGTALAWKW